MARRAKLDDAVRSTRLLSLLKQKGRIVVATKKKQLATQRVSIRVSEEEKAMFERAASRELRPLSSWIRAVLIREVTKQQEKP